MKDGLYNRGAYGLPSGAAEVFAATIATLDYANHALEESRADRYGIAELPGSLEIQSGDVVEVEVRGGSPVKAVVRFPYDEKLDLVLVLLPRTAARYFVKTVWFNQLSDKHRTLRLAPYSRP
jgi:hypothetical protein